MTKTETPADNQIARPDAKMIFRVDQEPATSELKIVNQVYHTFMGLSNEKRLKLRDFFEGIAEGGMASAQTLCATMNGIG